jgi:hypothetical protein
MDRIMARDHACGLASCRKSATSLPFAYQAALAFRDLRLVA